MPSQNSFSIRKLFSTSRRVSLIADETIDERFQPKHRSHASTSSGNASGASGASRGSTASRDSHDSQGSTSSTVFHPDSSFSITTPQAERGLTDNVDHELSQEEIDRIKAVVAAAAAAAASSLRLRMDEGSKPSKTVQTIRTIEMTPGERHVDFDAVAKPARTTQANEKETLPPRSAAESAIDDNRSSSQPENGRSQLRKKNRRIPQPIVVPPRPTPRSAGARPLRRSTDQQRAEDAGANERGEKGDRTEKGDRVDKRTKSDKRERRATSGHHRRIGSQGSQHSSWAKGGRSNQQHHRKQSHHKGSHGRSQETATRLDEQRRGRSDRSDTAAERHEAGTTLPNAAPAGNRQTHQNDQTNQTEGDARLCLDGDKHDSANTQRKQSRAASQAKQGDDVAAQRRSAGQLGMPAPLPSSKPRSSTVGASSKPKSTKTKTSPASPTPLSLYSTIPIASIVHSRKSLPALSPHHLSKALPPPPPPRGSSYFGTRSSWKPRPDKSLRSISTVPAHPLYRGQPRRPDGKKDSGIALDRSQTSLVGNTGSDTAYESVSDTPDDAESGSDAGSCIDLLQALAIQPEEADLLRRQTIDSTPTATTTPATTAIKTMDISRPLPADDDALKIADGTGLRTVCTTPTFTQPRAAPTPSPSAVPSAAPSEANTPRRVLSPSPSPRPSFMGSSRTSGMASPPPAAASPPSPKKQTRFLPLRLNKGLPDAALRIQRKRSTKKAAGKSGLPKSQPLEGKSRIDGGSSNGSKSNDGGSSGGSSRWTLPDNVTGLFNSRLFNRMEVTETLPFEKLQAIRESRALAQKQQEESEAKKKANQLQDELDEKEKRERQDRKQQQDLVDAEQALIKVLQQPNSLGPLNQRSDKDTAAVAPLGTLVECEEEEMQVSPVDPEDAEPFDADGNRIPPETPTPISPPTEMSLPPPCLPMPPHIALQMVWPGEEGYEEICSPEEAATGTMATAGKTQTQTLFLGAARDEPDGSTTPIEPFHMQDLPRRIGAAGVHESGLLTSTAEIRESILLTNADEQAYFTSSVAQNKERRRREEEEREKQAKREAEQAEQAGQESESQASLADDDLLPQPPKSPLDEIGPFPSPPTKNPMRFQSFIKKAALVPTNRAAPPPPLMQPPAQPIPQVTVTDVDSHSRRPAKAKGKEKARRSGAKTPKSTFFFPPSSLVPPSASSLSPSSSASSMAALAAASARPHHRDNATYVYLSATPFSLVMPTYRHGPIRLNRSDLEELRSNSRNSYERDHHRPNIATVDETLDWTAFQMAILGGAGDFFNDSVEYGHMLAIEADEADQLADWFWSLDIRPEQLFKSAKEDKEWVDPKTAASAPPPPPPPPSQAAPPPPTTAAPPHPSQKQTVLTHHTQRTAGPQWTSISSSIHTTASSTAAPRAPVIGPAPRGFSHRRTTTDTSIGSVASGYSSSGGSNVPASNGNTGNAPGLTPQITNLALSMSRVNSNTNSNTNSAYAMSRSNSTAASTAANNNCTPPLAAQPRTMDIIRASFASAASAASYESMPQSPMADLIMTRGADGKEYVAPMGYNLSHDLGDYLLWEQENVYAMTLDE